TRRKQGEQADISDYTYTLDVSAEDAGGRMFNGSGKVDVRRGEVDIQTQMASYYIGKGESVEVRVVLQGDKAKLDKGTAKVEFGRMVYGDSKESFDAEYVRTIDLSSGERTLSFTPEKSGNYVLKVTGVDSKGNRVASEDWVWVYGLGDGNGASLPSLRLIPDATQYEPGDTA